MNCSIRQVPNRLVPAGHDPAGQSKPARSRPIDRRKDFRVGRLWRCPRRTFLERQHLGRAKQPG